MAVPSLTLINYNSLSDAESTTGWTGATPALNTEIVRQGSNSIGHEMRSDLQTIEFFSGSAPSGAGKTFRGWLNFLFIGFLDIEANGGMEIFMSDGGAENAFFIDCHSGKTGTGFATIDMDGADNTATTPASFVRYSGAIKMIELTGGAEVDFHFSSGSLIIDSSCTNGTVVVRGDATVKDTGGNIMESGLYFGGLILINETTYDAIAGMPTAVWEHGQKDVNVSHMNGARVLGDGSASNKWRG